MEQPWICTCACGYSNCMYCDKPTYEECRECYEDLKKDFEKYLKELKDENTKNH